MSEHCIAEPISFLRLERHALGELVGAERASVQTHLSACASCRSCFDELRADEVALRPLPAPTAAVPKSSPRVRRRAPAALAWAAALAAAAVVVLSLRAALAPAPVPPARKQIKGGELALELVRERAGDVLREPTTFAPGDRFSALVTCPQAAPMRWDLVVFQAGRAFFPLRPRAQLACGNHVALDGAFSLTGDATAIVCVVLDARAPIDREQVARGSASALPETSVCVSLFLQSQ